MRPPNPNGSSRPLRDNNAARYVGKGRRAGIPASLGGRTAPNPLAVPVTANPSEISAPYNSSITEGLIIRSILFPALALLSFSTGVQAGEYRALIVSVLDGDTVRVRFVGSKPPANPNSRVRPKPNIRLRFSDTPEPKRKSPKSYL